MRKWEQDKLKPLTLAAFEAGEPCPGCGRPLLDNGATWLDRGTNLTERERAAREREEAAYRELHGDCHASRWTIGGSVTQHCSQCCPPHPITQAQLADVVALLRPR